MQNKSVNTLAINKTYIIHEVSEMSAYRHIADQFEGRKCHIAGNGYIHWADRHPPTPIYPHHKTKFADVETGKVKTKEQILDIEYE